jgi:hypothetical protein
MYFLLLHCIKLINVLEIKKGNRKEFDFRGYGFDSSSSSIPFIIPLTTIAFNEFCNNNKQVLETYNFWKEKIDELHYRLNYTYKLSVVKNRDANKSILARVKWQYKYKGEYRKPAYIGVYIGSLKDFPKGLDEININEVAKMKIEEYFTNKIPLLFKDINGNEYQL